MIEILSSKRMSVIIVILIIVCTFVVIIEEWFTNSQLVISSIITHEGGQQQIDANHIISQNVNNTNTGQDLPLAKPIDLTIKSKPVPTNPPINWYRFLNFLSLTGFFGSISGLLVKYRQLQLRSKSLSRFRKEKPNDSDSSSNHTLIDMDRID